MNRIDPLQAKALMDAGWTYLDVRSVPEFEAGHPAGALNVPLMNAENGKMVPNPNFLDTVQKLFGKNKQLILGCMAGGRSARAASLLEGDGYTQLADQAGGWGGQRDASGTVLVPGWSSTTLPTETGSPEGRSHAALLKKAAH